MVNLYTELQVSVGYSAKKIESMMLLIDLNCDGPNFSSNMTQLRAELMIEANRRSLFHKASGISFTLSNADSTFLPFAVKF